MSKEDKNKSEDNLKNHQVKEVLDDAIKAEANQAAEVDSENEENDKEAELNEELEKEKDKFLRLFAEFENFKRRTAKERIELFKTANQDVLTALLPVLDDFDRGLVEIRKANDKNLLKGVELIHTKLKDTLKRNGLEEMQDKQGDAFDADLHEAVTQIPAPNDKLKGKIVDVVEKGYRLGGERIVRYPKVVTGK